MLISVLGVQGTFFFFVLGEQNLRTTCRRVPQPLLKQGTHLALEKSGETPLHTILTKYEYQNYSNSCLILVTH